MEILEFPSLWGFVFIFAFSICKMTKAEHEQSHTLGTGYCLSLKCQEAESEVKPGFADRSPFLGTVQGQRTEPASNARLHGVCVWLEPGRARGRYWGESPRSTAHARTRAVGTSWAPPASPRSAVCSAGPGHFKTRTSGGLRAQERWLCPRPRPSTTSPREESNQLAKSDHVHAFCRHWGLLTHLEESSPTSRGLDGDLQTAADVEGKRTWIMSPPWFCCIFLVRVPSNRHKEDVGEEAVHISKCSLSWQSRVCFPNTNSPVLVTALSYHAFCPRSDETENEVKSNGRSRSALAGHHGRRRVRWWKKWGVWLASLCAEARLAVL